VDDRDIYAKEVADALEADLQPLVTSGVIKRISKYDTNPANNPQPPQRLRERASSSARVSSRRQKTESFQSRQCVGRTLTCS
jgi:hypothetical protein